ncbi:MAG: serine/threonine-protein kinase [Gemmataceae bacterium]
MGQVDLLDPNIFLVNLRKCGLLNGDQLARVGALELKGKDARALGRACIELGLLTQFQAERILNGKITGLILGQYRILEELGRGGMGRVYRAVHERMGRKVAIKVLSPQLMRSPKAQALFEREVRAISRLSHPNIVTAFDANVFEGRHFLVLELVDGPNLSQFLRKHGALNVDQSLEYAKQAALGLAHAHKRGLVHRDIKPGNLLISLEENDGKKVPGPVKISDFGLARLRDSSSGNAEESSLGVEEHSVTGTPDYISPEQARDVHLADIRSDIYSLGCTFYQCLTAKPPFEGNIIEKLIRHASEAPPNPKLVKPEIPDSVVLLLGRMMAKLPIQRFQTPHELVTEIERIQELLGSEGSGHWVSAEAIFPGGEYEAQDPNRLEDPMSLPVSTFSGLADSTLGPGVSPLIFPKPKSDSKERSQRVGIALGISVGLFFFLFVVFWMFGPSINPTSPVRSGL